MCANEFQTTHRESEKWIVWESERGMGSENLLSCDVKRWQSLRVISLCMRQSVCHIYAVYRHWCRMWAVYFRSFYSCWCSHGLYLFALQTYAKVIFLPFKQCAHSILPKRWHFDYFHFYQTTKYFHWKIYKQKFIFRCLLQWQTLTFIAVILCCLTTGAFIISKYLCAFSAMSDCSVADKIPR